MPHIVLKQLYRQKEGGRLVTYHPGDTVNLGRQRAMELIASGMAVDPFSQVSAPAVKQDGNGLVVLMEEERIAGSSFGGILDQVPVTYLPDWEGELPYKYTAVWNGKSSVTKEFLGYGWTVTRSNWEVAARLAGLHRTLQDIGTPGQKAVTKKLIGDLRLPVYAVDLIFFKRTERAAKFAKEYSVRASKIDAHHAFAQAWYLVKPILNTLPKDWIRA